MQNQTKKTIIQFTKFALAGGIVLLTHLLFLYLLTEKLHIWYLISSIFSYSLAIIFNFHLQKYFVFQNINQKQTKKQFLIYTILAIANLIANTALMYIAVSIFEYYYLFVQIGIVCAISCVNYIINRNFIFKE